MENKINTIQYQPMQTNRDLVGGFDMHNSESATIGREFLGKCTEYSGLINNKICELSGKSMK